MWKMLDDLAATDKAAYTELAQAGAEEMVREHVHAFLRCSYKTQLFIKL